MDIKQFTSEMPGELIPVEGIRGATHSFLPARLPPAWQWPADMWPILLEAHKELARLDGIGKHLPDPNLLLRPLQKREAQRSSKLEGTFTNPQQQLLFELEPIAPSTSDDTVSAFREVANYAVALRVGLEMLGDQVPFSQWLVRELHRISHGRRARFRTRTPAVFVPVRSSLAGRLASFHRRRSICLSCWTISKQSPGGTSGLSILWSMRS